jgi:hypothetical protein
MFAETPLSAISRSNWSPESAEARWLFKAPREDGSWFRLGTGLQLMQFNNPPSTKEKTKNMTILDLKKSIGRSPLRFALLLIPLALGCFALSQTARAVSPAPDGGYPNGNTAEGTQALLSLTTGIYDTALGAYTLRLDTSGSNNTAVGGLALSNNNGNGNTAMGYNALVNNATGNSNLALGLGALLANTTGSFNTAMGFQALQGNTADGEVAVGYQALRTNTTGQQNTAVGYQALYSNNTSGVPDVNGNTVGQLNTAVGYQALFKNTTGIFNTATGNQALQSNTIGTRNCATGNTALSSNTTGDSNTASGSGALGLNTTGSFNTAAGRRALVFNTKGDNNTAIGFQALASNTVGVANVAIGNNALASNTGNGNCVAIGVSALANSDAGPNTALGTNAGVNLTTGPFNIDIANEGVAGEANTIRIGDVQTATYIAGISGQDATGGDPVFITSSGKIGTVNPPSSARFKDEIKPMNKASEVILALKPVTFRYKKEFDPKRVPQFGLVAEEVEKINPDLVKRDRDGKLQTVRYDAVNAMLLNEFLKEHRKVEQQDATIAKQQKQIEALTRGLQKVSDQLELSKPAPRTVSNNQ